MHCYHDVNTVSAGHLLRCDNKLDILLVEAHAALYLCQRDVPCAIETLVEGLNTSVFWAIRILARS